VVLIAFLIIGLALPVLPLHVHQGLGLSTFVVGLVGGGQFAAAIISRVWWGRYADRQGAKRAVVVGYVADRDRSRRTLPPFASIRGRTLGLSHDPSPRPSAFGWR
jgi:MFS family permease